VTHQERAAQYAQRSVLLRHGRIQIDPEDNAG
jgi:hypothetical protein